VLVGKFVERYSCPVTRNFPDKLYDRVAIKIAMLIDRGTLRRGDRLPSVRDCSRQEKVSVATVLQAYLSLESQGLIEVRPKSGHYVRVRPPPKLSEPRAPRIASAPSRVDVAARIGQIMRTVSDPGIVQLGSAIVAPELLPVERLNRMLAQIARGAGPLGVAYDHPPGYALLRRQIARVSVASGCPLAPDEIITTVGASEALHLALRAVAKPGDVVAVESPAYYGLLQLIESLGIRVVEVPVLPGTGMDLDALEEALRTQRIAAVLAVPNFSNPSGTRMPDENKERLVEMLAAREVPLIEDDIYGDLHHDGERPRPAKSFDTRGLVLLCSSFSKTLAAGYRVGWIAPGRFHERVMALKFAHTVATPTLPQMAIAEFLATGGYEHHLRRLRRSVGHQVSRVSEAVSAAFPAGTRISRPRGGFVLWAELPDGKSGLILAEQALQKGIAIAPGQLFSARERFQGFIRLSCGKPWSEAIEKAVGTLGQLAHAL
jgi:DNA-binding transcriptional MocR family regulator